MKSILRAATAVSLSVALGACQPGASSVAAEPVVLKSSMQEIVALQTDLSNVLIEALDDQGEVDPAKLTEDNWATLESAASKLRDKAVGLRDGEIRVVATPGETIEGEGAPGALAAAQVQALIDGDPSGFKAHAGPLLAEAERLTTAGRSRDAAIMWEATLNLDAVCSSCHMEYWYPEPPQQP